MRHFAQQAADWLWRESQSADFDQERLGHGLYQRWPDAAAWPGGLDQIVGRLLAPNPRDRYPGVESLLWDLEGGRWLDRDFIAACGVVRLVPAQPALIGRARLLEQLLELPEGITLLSGPAGMGKTRLLQEAARHALAAGWTVWRAECLQGGWLSWQPFQDLAAELSRRPELWPEVQAKLGDWLPAVLRLFPVLRPLCDQAPEEFANREFLGERNRQASLALLQALGPAVLIVDDLHWAEPEVLEALAELSWPVLAGSRGAVAQARRVLPLRALDVPQVEQLARSMCGPVECPELHAWSQGHPLLAASLLRNLCETGALQPGPDGWKRSQRQPSWGALSPNLEELLKLRCLNLSPALRQAALLGRRFSARLLEGAGDVLPEAQAGGLVYEVEPGIWDFTHDLIFQELRKATGPSEKIVFHREVAERLLAEAAPDTEAVADHLWEGNQLEQCLPWTLRAARQSQQEGRLEAAAHYWERAAHLRPDDLEGWFEWGCALRYLGRHQQALPVLERSLGLCRSSLQRASCRAMLGENAWRSGDLAAAAEHFRRGLAELGIRVPRGPLRWLAIARELSGWGAGPPILSESQRLAARMLDQLAYTVVYTDGIGLVWSNLRGLRLTANSDGLERGILLASHAVIVLYVPALLGRARRCIEQALQLVAGDPHQLAATQARHGTILLFTGQLEQAVLTSRAAQQGLAQSGDRYDLRMTRYNLAYELYFLGEFGEAGRLAFEGWRDACQARDWLAAGYSARVMVVLGLVPEGVHRHFSDPQAQPMVEALRLEVLGLLQLVRGRPELAASYLEQALGLSRRLGLTLDTAWQAGWLATAYRCQAELAPLASRAPLYRKGLAAAEISLRLGKAGYRIYLPHALREAAWCRLGLGFRSESFQQSLDWGQRLNMREQVRLTSAEMARAGVAGGTPCSSDFWQFQAPAASAQLLSGRFEEAIQQARRVLAARTPPEVLVRAEEAAEVLLGATSCRVLRGGESLSRPVVEHTSTRSEVHCSLLIPLGVHWGESLKLACYHRHLPDRFGEEEIYLGSFLGEVVGAAVENAALLEERGSLFEAVPVGVASLDGKGVVLQANSALREMLGPDLEGRALSEFEYRGPAAEGCYLGRAGNLIWADKRVSQLGPERSVVSLSDVSWRRLHQVAAFQEQERRLLSIEIHDVSQPLIGLCYQQGPAAEVARRMLNDLRSLMFDLRSPQLDDFDLAESLSDLVHESGLQCRVEIAGDVAEIGGLPGLFAYRIVVEGMSNIRRHAQADRVLLRMRRVESQLWGSLCDDGQVLPGTSSRRSLGLQGIGERAQLLGGWGRFRRFQGYGILHFRLPLERS